MNEDLKTKLVELGLNDAQIEKLIEEGVAEDSDMQSLNSDEIKTLTGCGLVVAKKVAKGFAPEVSTTDGVIANMGNVLEVLPPVQSDEDWLTALKVGGIPKFSKETVTATISAALANHAGLYDLPKKLSDAMETQAKSLGEPVGNDFYKLQRLLTRRDYSEVFAAMPGIDGHFATKERKRELLARIEDKLWNSLLSFHTLLKQWVETWQQGMANPAALMTMMAAGSAGGSIIPQGMMQPPPTDALRDTSELIINDINYIFAGTGIPVSLALAYDAQQIRKALENPSLPAQVGATNREQMLQTLGVAVSSDYPRLERSLKQYTLGITEFRNIPVGQEELQYIFALYQLGNMVPWPNSDRLEGPSGKKLLGGRMGDQL